MKTSVPVENGRLLARVTKARNVVAALCESRVPILVLSAYVTLFAIQYVIVRASQTETGGYSYNITLVVAFTEAVKLFIASAFLLKEYSLRKLCALFRKYWSVPLLYAIPSALYCISNNLVFLNLQAFEPTTYNVLLQLRIVLTGILFQLIFKRVLSRVQWLALLLLTTGCIVKQLGADGSQPRAAGSLLQLVNLDGALLLAQILCSCLASVLNELFLKEDTGPIMLNNFCMYFTSVIANVLAITARSTLYDAVGREQLAEIILQPLVLAIILNGAASGMMIPLFLCYFNSITRVFTVSIELTLMAVTCWVVFGTPIDLQTLATIIIVSIATYFYVTNPVRDTVTRGDAGKSVDETNKEVIANASDDSGITISVVQDTAQEHDEEPLQVVVTKL